MHNYIDLVYPHREGRGAFTYRNGDLYTGKFRDDAFNGKGKIKFGSLDVYEGDFVDGKLEGVGRMEFKVILGGRE